METLTKRLKILIWVILAVVSGTTEGYSQCITSNFAGTISPTVPWQTVPCVRGGEYLEFNAVAGDFYTFTVCMGGGFAGWDTQLTITDASNVFASVPYHFNDDACGAGSYLAYWPCPATGTYRIHVTQFNCQPSVGCAILAYKKEATPGGVGTTCANNVVIPSLPYQSGGLSTCGFGNDYNNTGACGSSYMNSEDYVFTYDGTAGECISVFLDNTFTYTGLFIMDGCPNAVGASCVDFAEGGAGNPFLSNVTLPTTGTYYIVVSGNPAVSCTPFDIEVVNCPSAGQGNDCASALNIPSLPYEQRGLTTCGRGDDFDNTNACGSPYMNGDDFVFTYTSPGNECIRIELSNTDLYTGFFVFDGCPTTAPTCIAQRTELGGNPYLRRIDLVNPGTYYIVVATSPGPQCTGFDIQIDPCSPLCTLNTNGSDACATPTPISLGMGDTICGFTDLNYTQDGGTVLGNNFCGTIENNLWFSFVADSSQMSFQINVGNCLSGFGVQAAVFEVSNCTSFNQVSNCWNPMYETGGFIQASGLTVGNTYYLMVDGYAGDDCEFTMHRVTGPLPVEFGPFTADVKGLEVDLNWETYSEVNSKGFVLERGQEDAKGEVGHIQWEEITWVDGKGDSPSGHQYNTNDEVVFNGKPYYYRLHQIDLNGSSDFSEVLRVEIEGPDASEILAVYPNPASDRLNIQYFADRTGEVQFELFSITGQRVLEQGFDGSQAGVFEQEVNLQGLETGIYIYRLSVGARVFRGKVDVIH